MPAMEVGLSSYAGARLAVQDGSIAMTTRQLACTSCRTTKVKCKPLHAGATRSREQPCLRCVKMGLECHYPTRKKRGGRISSDEPPVIRGITTSATPVVPYAPAPGRDVNLMAPGSSRFSAGRLYSPDVNEVFYSHPPDLHHILPIPNEPERETMIYQPPSCLYGTSCSPRSDFGQPIASSSTHSAIADRTSRPRAAMSFKQELQEVKDDLGIPGTRDASRAASPELPLDHPTLSLSPGLVWEGRLAHVDTGASAESLPELSSIMTGEEVALLFQKFFENHNTCIGLLDPDLHTPSYTYSTSRLLFHAILAVTAGAFRPDLYTRLWQRTKAMISSAFAAAEESIELCQAVSLVNVWNDPEDKSGSLRFGFAVRIAYHLGLDRPLRRPLPPDEMAARRVLNGERTWFHLALWETVVNGMYGGMTPMIHPEPAANVLAWFRDHPQYHCPSDIVHVANASSYPIFAEFISPRGARKRTSDERKQSAQRFRSWRAEWTLTWLAQRPLGESLSRGARDFFGFVDKAIVRDCTSMARLDVDEEDRVESLWNDIYAAIDSLRQIASDTSPRGILFWGQNSVALHASKCGMLLTNHITSLTPATAQGIMDMFEDIVQASSSGAAAGSRKLYLAKLFGSLIKVSARRLAFANKPSRELVEGFNSRADFTTEETTQGLGVSASEILPTSMPLSPEGAEDQRQLEAFLDDYVMQFSQQNRPAYVANVDDGVVDVLQLGSFAHEQALMGSGLGY